MLLSCFDDKKLVLDDGIHTRAYFYQGVKKQIHTDDHKKRFSQIKTVQKNSHGKKEIFTNKKNSKRSL